MKKKKLTIPEMKVLKEAGKKFVATTAYDYPSAVLVEKTDIEMILVGDSLGMTVLGYESTVSVTMEEMLHHIKAVIRGASGCFVVGDMPFGSYNTSIRDAIANANRMMKEGGLDAVKLEGGAQVCPTVRALVRAGIPVMGHIGLTPQTVSQMGGYRIQGTDQESAGKLIKAARLLEEAGACGIVLECIPAGLAATITAQLKIPTIGIGAGPACDAQVLVYHDMLGLYDRFIPRFVKPYADLGKVIIGALDQYAREVRSGEFPGEEHSFGSVTDELDIIY